MSDKTAFEELCEKVAKYVCNQVSAIGFEEQDADATTGTVEDLLAPMRDELVGALSGARAEVIKVIEDSPQEYIDYLIEHDIKSFDIAVDLIDDALAKWGKP